MVKSKVSALSLTGITTNVQLTKLPAVEESIDTLPLAAVVPSESPEEVRPAAFENQAHAVYSVDVVLVSKGKRLLGMDGNTDANDDLARQLQWRESVRKAFYDPRALGVTGLWLTEVRPGPPIDRGKVNANFDYLPLTLRFHTLEQGTN